MSTPRHLAAADALRESHEAAAGRIRARPELSDRGRQMLLARNYLDAKSQMSDLEQTAHADDTVQRAQTERSVFGTSGLPGDAATLAVSYRDAQDRAAVLTSPADAAALLARATRSNDEPLARAVAAHSHDQASTALGGLDSGWTDVVDTYTASRPEAARSVNTLRSLAGATTVRDMFAHVLAAPSELSRVPASQLQDLADAAP